MEALPWFWVWIVLAAVLLVGEMLTTSFFMLPFALGAAVAALTEALGGNLIWQWVAFIVISVISLILFRPLAKRITPRNSQKSGVDRLIGSIGKVLEGTSLAGEGRARVGTEVWNVVTEDGGVPPVGSVIEVLAVDGAHLVVRVAEANAAELQRPGCPVDGQ
jgi:membrane protein implicated in regulation of membrane protease activity